MSDFAEVRRLLVAGAKATYADLRAKGPGEQFYVFALYDCDDATGPQVSANSVEKFQELLPRHRRLYVDRGRPYGPREEAHCRWGPAEWWHEACSDLRDFALAYGLLEALAEEASARDAHAEFRASSFAAMAGALCDLRREGVFDAGGTGEPITLFASLSDSADAEWLERESARVANPPEVFARFEREALAPPPEPTTESAWSERSEWESYQRKLTQPPSETQVLFMQLVGSWGGPGSEPTVAPGPVA